jgi:hypothetical protein
MSTFTNYCDDQMKYRIVWFLLPTLIIPCLFMPVGIYVMLNYAGGIGANFSFFLFVSMLMYIMNMVFNVGGKDTRITISMFIATVVFDVAYPLLSAVIF